MHSTCIVPCVELGGGGGSDDVLRQAKHYFLSMLIDYFIYLNECVCTPLIVRNL